MDHPRDVEIPHEPELAGSTDGLVDLADRLVTVGTAALADGGAVVVDGLSLIDAAGCVAGRAATAWVPHGDNLALQVAVASAEPGQVVVCAVDRGDLPGRPVALVGDVLAAAASRAGIPGIVVDGEVRDVAAMAAFPVLVSARGRSPRGPTKRGGGGVDVAVVIAGVVIEPGDWITIDGDGVVVLAAGAAVHILAAAEAKVAPEPAMLREIAAGRSTLDVLGLYPGVIDAKRHGVPYPVG